MIGSACPIIIGWSWDQCRSSGISSRRSPSRLAASDSANSRTSSYLCNRLTAASKTATTSDSTAWHSLALLYFRIDRRVSSLWSSCYFWSGGTALSVAFTCLWNPAVAASTVEIACLAASSDCSWSTVCGTSCSPLLLCVPQNSSKSSKWPPTPHSTVNSDWPS